MGKTSLPHGENFATPWRKVQIKVLFVKLKLLVVKTKPLVVKTKVLFQLSDRKQQSFPRQAAKFPTANSKKVVGRQQQVAPNDKTGTGTKMFLWTDAGLLSYEPDISRSVYIGLT